MLILLLLQNVYRTIQQALQFRASSITNMNLHYHDYRTYVQGCVGSLHVQCECTPAIHCEFPLKTMLSRLKSYFFWILQHVNGVGHRVI